jgi:hypothetical protein
VSDSEALRRNRCLGMLGCDRLKLGWLCAIAVWGCWESDCLKLGGCVRSLFGDVGYDFLKLGLCAIAVWDVGVR